jgi:dTDP-4-amino-4,6-dideoxygalactose transaminase
MIAPRNWITADDRRAVYNFLELGAPLSGYLAGNPHGGAAVQRLEEMWCAKFGRQHAIAVNSATSGLLAACEALDVRNKRLAVPALSMSATVAVPAYLGAGLTFVDVDAYGCANPHDYYASAGQPADVIILTTLFGHPPIQSWRNSGLPIILDNAQGICARDSVGWADGLGDVTVTSMNVHKQINAGEGGVISTDDDALAEAMRRFINHGEMTAAASGCAVGLNLRMTELSAVLTLSQLARINGTIEQLNDLCDRLDDIMPMIFTPLGVREGCYSARYCYAFAVDDAEFIGMHRKSRRDRIVEYLTANGVPAIPMYRPLYELPAFAAYKRHCPTAEQMADSVVVLELCSWRFDDDLPAVARALEGAAKL